MKKYSKSCNQASALLQITGLKYLPTELLNLKDVLHIMDDIGRKDSIPSHNLLVFKG